MKDRIRQKANELFRRYGVKSITMDEIATQLGASKKTLYQFYSDKDELVEAVAEEWIHFSEGCCNRYRSTCENAIDEIFLAMDFVQELFSNMNPSMLYDLQKYYPNAFNKFLAHKNQYLYKSIRENLERGIAEQLYRDDINLDIITKFRLESMLMPFNIEMFPSGKFTMGELEREILMHYLFGVASLKGHKLILKYLQRNKLESNEKKILK